MSSTVRLSTPAAVHTPFDVAAPLWQQPAPARPPGFLDLTPISQITKMRLEPWLDWLHRGGDGSFGALFPDITDRILTAIVHGAPVDFIGDRSVTRGAVNPPSDDPRWDPMVSDVIAADCAAKKKAGPFSAPPFLIMSVSPVYAIPKNHGRPPLKLRFIHNLSYPRKGLSVNADIRALHYKNMSFGHAVRAVVKLGPGCWLVKIDIEAAYKQIPVRPEDWPLLGFKWLGEWFYERVLPFGLRSSCRIWEDFALALHHLFERVLLQTGSARDAFRYVIHYVDDFLFVVRTKEAAVTLSAAAGQLATALGVPFAAEKTESAQCLTFLGLELDTVHMEARLPAAKKANFLADLDRWLTSGTMTIDDLQSLGGFLGHVCDVVPAGRFYKRRLISFSMQQKAVGAGPRTPLQISDGVREELRWWREFVPSWVGTSILRDDRWISQPSHELFTDACDIGYGCYWDGAWVANTWTPAQLAVAQRAIRTSMPFLELFALVAAAATWGPSWSQKNILFRTDSAAAASGITHGKTKEPGLCFLLRHLCTLACRYGFDYRAVHIAGADNTIADVLSRSGDCPQFRSLCPRAAASASVVPHIPLPPLQGNA